MHTIVAPINIGFWHQGLCGLRRAAISLLNWRGCRNQLIERQSGPCRSKSTEGHVSSLHDPQCSHGQREQGIMVDFYHFVMKATSVWRAVTALTESGTNLWWTGWLRLCCHERQANPRWFFCVHGLLAKSEKQWITYGDDGWWSRIAIIKDVICKIFTGGHKKIT